MIKIISSFILIIIISGANAQPLVIRPRKESTVLSNREKIQTIKEFGDWLESCNHFIIDQDDNRQIKQCKTVQDFMKFGWRYQF